MRKFPITAYLAFGLLCATSAQALTARDVINGYADLALAKYSDSLDAAQALDRAIAAFVADPTAATHGAAKQAWLDARVPYQQTEGFRFGNATVDAWEGKVNAWPLDEGLIDYVDAGFYGAQNADNVLYAANVVANPNIISSGITIDAGQITPALLQQLHEADGVEANVATGYHAIEFLLWGQDLNGTGSGAGARSHSDFDTANCTNGNCDRRAAYLMAASELLITDLEDIAAAWQTGGAARADLAGQTDAEGIASILTGLGSLSYGELAGERMQLGLILHDPEEEHDCFSDNTHNSHYYNALGMQNIYLGRYRATDGTVMEVPALADLVAAADAGLNNNMTAKLDATLAAMGAMKDRADSGVEAYDQMIAFGNDAGNTIVQTAIDRLVDQTRSIEAVVAAITPVDVAIEGSDSLDNPGAVFE